MISAGVGRMVHSDINCLFCISNGCVFLANGCWLPVSLMQSVRLVVTDQHLRFSDAKLFTNWFNLAGVFIISRGT